MKKNRTVQIECAKCGLLIDIDIEKRPISISNRIAMAERFFELSCVECHGYMRFSEAIAEILDRNFNGKTRR